MSEETKTNLNFNLPVTELTGLEIKQADIKKALEDTKEITKENSVEEIKAGVKKLTPIRTSIEKTGKSVRDQANAFAKEVIEFEKDLKKPVAERESELKQFLIDKEEEAKVEARRRTIPWRLGELKKLKIKMTEDELMEMDDERFDNFLNQKKSEKEQAKLHEKQIEDAKKKAVEDTEKRIQKEAKEKEERDKKEAKAEERKQKKNKEYQAWLKEIKFDKETMILKDDGESINAYTLTSKFNKN